MIMFHNDDFCLTIYNYNPFSVRFLMKIDHFLACCAHRRLPFSGSFLPSSVKSKIVRVVIFNLTYFPQFVSVSIPWPFPPFFESWFTIWKKFISLLTRWFAMDISLKRAGEKFWVLYNIWTKLVSRWFTCFYFMCFKTYFDHMIWTLKLLLREGDLNLRLQVYMEIMLLCEKVGMIPFLTFI